MPAPAAGRKRPRPAEPSSVGKIANGNSKPSKPRASRSVSNRGQSPGKGAGTQAKRFDKEYDFEISSGEELDEETQPTTADKKSAALDEDEETADAKRRRLANNILSLYKAEAAADASDDEEADTDSDIKDAVGKRLLQEVMSQKTGAIIFDTARAIKKALEARSAIAHFHKCSKLSVTGVAITGDASRVFISSKDCTITCFDVNTVDATAHKAFVLPGRRRVKADTLKQQRAEARYKETGVASGYTGVKHVISSGFGGGRIGGGSDSATAASAPKISHADGVSSIVFTREADGGGSANRSAIAKLRTVPDYDIPGHWAEIYAIAVSSDGKYLVSAGKDRMVRVWDATAKTGATPAINLENFIGHKDSVTGLAFRHGSHTLYSCSTDRCVKVWNLDEMAYVDTLFGHQADVVDIDAIGAKDRCVTAGRDRTVRLWRIPEQTQLVFRAHTTDISTDVVAAINDSWYVSGGADGSLSLWHTSKKKPVARMLHAHGDGIIPSIIDETSATPILSDKGLEVLIQAGLHPDAVAVSTGYCHWITAIAVCPAGNVLATGSGDGFIRFWKLVGAAHLHDGDSSSSSDDGTDDEEEDSKKHGKKGGKTGDVTQRALLMGQETQRLSAFRDVEEIGAVPVKGIVTSLRFSGDGGMLAAAVGQEHRLGRWWHYKKAENGVLLVKLPVAR